jgi:drug/metabolite transporter (DMT)-like permease
MPFKTRRKFSLGNIGLFATAAVCLWSTAAPVFALIDPGIPVTTVVALQYIISAVIIVAYNVVMRGRLPFANGAGGNSSGVDVSSIDLRLVYFVFLFALLNVTHELSYYFGIRSPCAFEANILNYLWPVWLFIFSVALTWRASPSSTITKGILPLLLAFVGVVIMLFSAPMLNTCGFAPKAAGFVSSLSAAGYMVVFTRLSTQYRVSFLALLTLTLPILALAFGISLAFVPWYSPAIVANLPLILYLALFTVVVPEVIWAAGLARFGGAPLAKWAYLIPLLSTLLLTLVKKQMPTYQTLGGGLIILVSVWISSRFADD